MASKDKGKAIAGSGSSAAGKRKPGDDKSGGGSRKRRNPGALQFFEHSAAEADGSDDSDMDDFMEEELEAEPIVQGEPGKARNLPFIPKEEEVDGEEFERMMEERYRTGSTYVTYAEDNYENKRSIDGIVLEPSAKDPVVWKVKCAVGRERHSAFCMMQKFVDLGSMGTKLQIISAFAVDHIKGFVFIEADKLCDVQEACKGLCNIFLSQVTPVPKSEAPTLLAPRTKNSEIAVGTWARVKSGNYKGDLGQVVAVNEKKIATVKLIPRIDLQAMALKFGGGVSRMKLPTPAPRLISTSELEEFRPLIQHRKDKDTGLHFLCFDGLLLKDGYLYKKVPLDSLICRGVVQSDEEILKFKPSENNESTDLEWLSQLYGENKKRKSVDIDIGDGKGEGSSKGNGKGEGSSKGNGKGEGPSGGKEGSSGCTGKGESYAPRMPEIYRAPTPGPTVSDGGSSGVQMPPPHLFLPRMIPALPAVDNSGTPIYPLPPSVAPSASYQFVSFDTSLISARVSSSATETESVSSAASPSGTVGAKPTKKKRGPVTGKALEKTVNTSGRIVIDTDGDNHIVSGGKSRTYSGRVGALIRDRVPMLWSDWGEVPQEVKDMVHNAMSVWFDVPEHLKNSWADVVHGRRYKEWKNELRTHWTTHGNARSGTPAEFQYREYEWRWLLTSEFNNPHKQAVSRANAQNRQRNTRNHHAGSRPFAVFMDEAAREHPEVNRYVYTYEKAYPNAQEDIAKVMEASDEVMSAIVREAWPDTQEEEMSEAMSRIDTSDLKVGARIMGTAFPPRGNNFYCRGLGKKGEGVLKTTPGFQRKAASTSSRTTQLESEVQRLREQQAAQAAYTATVYVTQQAQQQQMFQYLQEFTAAQLQGLPAPPMPTPIPLPQPP